MRQQRGRRQQLPVRQYSGRALLLPYHDLRRYTFARYDDRPHGQALRSSTHDIRCSVRQERFSKTCDGNRLQQAGFPAGISPAYEVATNSWTVFKRLQTPHIRNAYRIEPHLWPENRGAILVRSESQSHGHNDVARAIIFGISHKAGTVCVDQVHANRFRPHDAKHIE